MASVKTALRNTRAVLILCALVSPLLAILFSQALRGELILRAYDGPLRIFLAGIIFIHVLNRRIHVVKALEWGFPIGICFLALAIVLNPDASARWSGRFATYFVDPLTLGQYAIFYGFVCLFMINLTHKDSVALKSFKYLGFFLALWIAAGTGSRSGWVAIPVLFLLWMTSVRKISSPLRILLAFALLPALILVAYEVSSVFHDRIDQAIADYTQYFMDGNRDTSGGLRLSLWRSAWHLFLENPVRGYGDANFPPLSSIPAIAPFSTPLLEHYLTRTGAHNEFLQNVLRSGLFGLVSSLLMFVVPFSIFYRGVKSVSTAAGSASVIGLCYIVALFVFGINTECFNLKYTSSFYGLMIAALAAQALRSEEIRHDKS
jgi:O-antigen ligase